MVDYAAGSFTAKKEKNWSSAIAREGLWHKLGEIFAVLVAALADIALKVLIAGAGITMPFDIGPALTPIVLMWYTLTEIGSIIENCGKLGAPVPRWFKQSVEKYKDQIDNSRNTESKPAPEQEPELVEADTVE